jgi:alkanesulfonate monooxygenase SsuD/methylene tetrahydromethanopterin reductase-like flavin-dependent oxidoreductase (luciferase family)
MSMKYAVDLPNFGPFGDARVLADLAQAAEDADWDGFFIWDHVYWGAVPHVDPWVALAVIALQTQRIRIGTMITPIPRRRVHKLARETVSIDHLSSGRLILGVGSGGGEAEYDLLGEADTAQARGALLDEGLEILTGLWSGETVRYQGRYLKAVGPQFQPTPVQKPRIPIWVAGMWPNKKPMQRGARYDGIFPLTRAAGLDGMVTVDEMRAAIDYVAERRGDRAFDVAHAGRSTGDPAQDRAIIEPYAAIGVTWWLENTNPWAFGWSGQGDWPVDAMRARIEQGPPRF